MAQWLIQLSELMFDIFHIFDYRWLRYEFASQETYGL